MRVARRPGRVRPRPGLSALFARLLETEEEAIRDQAIGPCGAYLVLRKRAGQTRSPTANRTATTETAAPSRTLSGT